MNIAETKAEMLGVVESLRTRLPGAGDACSSDTLVQSARRQVARIRKAFKRRIDERARCKPGQPWFSIHAREGIERELQKIAAESLRLID